MKNLGDSKVVGTSLLVSVSDVALNITVAFFTGSAVMLSQALQGLSDLITAGTLYHGVRRSKRDRDQRHPFGYGREIFFWVLIAAVFMFFGTGLLSIYFGAKQFTDTKPVAHIGLALAMVVFGFITNLYAFSLSVRRLNQTEGLLPWWRRLITSTMVETKATFLIDFLGTLAALLGLTALLLLALTGDARLDGAGAIAVGISMMVGAILLVYDVKSLIVGRSVPEATLEKITHAALSIDGVEDVLDLRTMYIGSTRLLVVIEVHLADGLETNAIESISDRIKHAIVAVVPHAYTIQVEVETPENELGEQYIKTRKA